MRRLLLAAALLTIATSSATGARAAADPFPKGFLWGTAEAGFQSEAGGRPSFADARSDYWRFMTDPQLIKTGVVSGDSPANGPGFWRMWKTDIDNAKDKLHNNAIRIGIEWSRLFPHDPEIRLGSRPTVAALKQMDRKADPFAVARYMQILAYAKRRGLTVMVTLNHYTLPLWVHDPLMVRRALLGRDPNAPLPAKLLSGPSGWLNAATITRFRDFASWAAWRLGRYTDLWATLNEPVVEVVQGYVSIPGVTGVKPPAVLSYPAALRAIEQLGLANAQAYDQIKRYDRGAEVGTVHNMVDWRPADPSSAADVAATRNIDRIFNRAWLDIVVRGRYDTNLDGVEQPGESRPQLANRADFIGVNHYQPGFVTALGAPVTPLIPGFDFAPQSTFKAALTPSAPPCPGTCSDFGWPIDPSGMLDVLREAAAYGKPIYITENGIADARDRYRASYITGYLGAVREAIARGGDVRGYFHWSLTDNFEWAEGFAPKFGLYGYNRRTLRRTMRPSARVYARIAKTGRLP